MKFVKGISLYFIYPMAMLCIGFYGGVLSSHFFYPGEQTHENGEAYEAPSQGGMTGETVEVPENLDYRAGNGLPEELVPPDEDLLLEAAAASETLSADTEYVLEETNILDQSVVRTTWRLPRQYMGMNRQQFLETMELYEAHPPLSERERGFVGLEVLSFSRERVVVRMDYRYVQPSASFYLAVYDNEVVVYLEDKRTVYINTEIPLDSLPENVQQEIIQMMWMPDEESLYQFLESYSS
ncbi:MAG: hypothetical protein NC420_02780 [Eubacterium sp.]|nr:hypothetical protein [Eubacterium sp.]MCM1216594.1 hypothetical protein [Lachnospiraceae bacterium]MCM1303000.1 hypothetical protein [Butyrivibrio sp.]MCM1343791.1 hypothetical protein [Muribaculaceae bacterium]MCM1239737.1 hypothetical protein [Lachnospiraceae bacterium]